MDCPPVSPGGGSEVPEALLEPGVGGGAHREPVVKVGGAPGARPGRGEAGRRGSGIGSWRGCGRVGFGYFPVFLWWLPLWLGTPISFPCRRLAYPVSRELHVPTWAKSGSWRSFLRACFPGAGANLGDPTHTGRQNMDKSVLCS